LKTKTLLAAAISAAALNAAAQTPPAQPPAQPPDCRGPEHHQFDFWIGDWNVTDPKGEKQGENRITAVQKDCALLESWTGAKGGTGNSLNFYDRATKKWHQTWISNSGGALLLDGGFADGKMVLVGERDLPKGGHAKHRITWEKQKDASVRQVWDTSTDGGKSWTTAFDGIYKKK